MPQGQGAPHPPRARFEEAWRNHSSAILAYAARRTRDPEDAADVLADTFLVAWRRLSDLPDEPEARLWLFAVARKVLANQHRTELRRGALTETLIQQTASLTAAFLRPQAEDRRSEQLAAALASLPEADREVLLLAGWEELSAAQIAVVLGCSAPTARVKLHRARRRLADRLEALTSAPDPPPVDVRPHALQPNLEVPR